jgi:immune inhibitor A
MPPSPDVLAMLYMDYLRVGKPQGLNFFQYLAVVGYSNPAHNKPGMDDARQTSIEAGVPVLIDVPSQPLVGELRVKVLLIDFADRPGNLPVHHYESLLFSQGDHPTGSMYDFYQEVSQGKSQLVARCMAGCACPNSIRSIQTTSRAFLALPRLPPIHATPSEWQRTPCG